MDLIEGHQKKLKPTLARSIECKQSGRVRELGEDGWTERR